MDWIIRSESEQSIKDSFDSIAKSLFEKVVLNINEKRYRIVDFEFYYKNNHHLDDYTLPHNVEAGRLRPHDYGVDISLGNSFNGYGGILIRGMIRENDNKVVRKPQVWQEIISALQMGDNKISFEPTMSGVEVDFITTVRHFLGDPEKAKTEEQENKRKFINAPYRYVLFHKEYLKELKIAKSEVVEAIRTQLLKKKGEETVKAVLGYVPRTSIKINEKTP